MYVDMMSADSTDPTGIADWVGYTDGNQNHPDWFLQDAGGNRLIFQSYPSARVMDVGNEAYQDAGIAHVVAMAKAAGFDGVFLDDANASLRWVVAGGLTASVSYPTDPAWQAAVYSFFTRVAPQLHAAGLDVVANIGRQHRHAGALAEVEHAAGRRDGGSRGPTAARGRDSWPRFGTPSWKTSPGRRQTGSTRSSTPTTRPRPETRTACPRCCWSRAPGRRTTRQTRGIRARSGTRSTTPPSS